MTVKASACINVYLRARRKEKEENFEKLNAFIYRSSNCFLLVRRNHYTFKSITASANYVEPSDGIEGRHHP